MNAPLLTVPRDKARFDGEVGLLGSLLAHGDPAAYRTAAAIVGPEHFSDPFNTRLFLLVGKGVEQGLSKFPLTRFVMNELKADIPVLSEINHTPSSIVARYVADADPSLAVEGDARQIKHDHLSAVLQEAAASGDTVMAEKIAAEMQTLHHAYTESEGAKQTTAGMNSILERLSETLSNGTVPALGAHPGSATLASVITAWRPGRFYVLGARPAMGKTSTALSWLLRTARNHNVMFFSLEMGAEELLERALSDVSYNSRDPIPYQAIGRNDVTTAQFERIYDAKQHLDGLKMVIDDRAGLTLDAVRLTISNHRQKLQAKGEKLEVVCIDHMGLIRASDRYSGNKVAETEEISGALKVMAKEFNCAVIALLQLNRGVEGRDDKRPGLSDLRWSGAIEQDADVVMFVYREAYYLERSKRDDKEADSERLAKLERCRNTLEIVFGKHRGGPCPVVEFYCDMSCGAVRDLQR